MPGAVETKCGHAENCCASRPSSVNVIGSSK